MVGLSLTKLLLEEGYNVVHVSRSKNSKLESRFICEIMKKNTLRKVAMHSNQTSCIVQNIC